MFMHSRSSSCGARLARGGQRLASLTLTLVLAGLPALVRAGDSQIELSDGSVLIGELVGVTQGGYRVLSPVLGEVQLTESDVVSIRPVARGGVRPAPAGPQAGGTAADPGTAVAAIQQQLLADPAVLASIMALQGDPEIQAALADPQFAQLLLSGNLAALSADPRIQRLLSHPAIQALLGRVAVP